MQKYTEDTILTFGKYKGKMLKEVPSSYLLMLYRKGIAFGAMRLYIHDSLEVLNAEMAINRKTITFDKKYYLGRKR